MIRADLKVRMRVAHLLLKGADNEIQKGLDRGSLIVLRGYKENIPVNTGNARQMSQRSKDGRLGWIITTKATNSGKPYPLFVHEGTGQYAGVTQDFPSTGRIRNGEDNRGIGGIRPNKFADRTIAETKEEVNNEVLKALNNIRMIDKTYGRS